MPVSATPRIVRGSEGSEVIEWLATVPSPTVETIAAFAAVLVIAPVAITKAMATIATTPLDLSILGRSLDAHAADACVSLADGRACGRPCHDRSVTQTWKWRVTTKS